MRTAAILSTLCATLLLTVAAGAGEPSDKADVLLRRLAARHGYLAAPGHRPIVPAWLLERDPASLPLLIISSDPDRTADAAAG